METKPPHHSACRVDMIRDIVVIAICDVRVYIYIYIYTPPYSLIFANINAYALTPSGE